MRDGISRIESSESACWAASAAATMSEMNGIERAAENPQRHRRRLAFGFCPGFRDSFSPGFSGFSGRSFSACNFSGA